MKNKPTLYLPLIPGDDDADKVIDKYFAKKPLKIKKLLRAPYKVGDKSKAICNRCRKIVPATMRLGNYRISRKKVMIPNILLMYCDNCGKLVGIPHQSTPKIRDGLKDQLLNKKTTAEAILTNYVKGVIPRDYRGYEMSTKKLDYYTVTLRVALQAIREAMNIAGEERELQIRSQIGKYVEKLKAKDLKRDNGNFSENELSVERIFKDLKKLSQPVLKKFKRKRKY